MGKRNRLGSISYDEMFCRRCGVLLRYENTYRGRSGGPGRVYCRLCWPYVARGDFDLALPPDWLGKGNGLLRLPKRPPRKPRPDDTKG